MSGMANDDLVTYVFTWRTVDDERVCRICMRLNGKEFHQTDIYKQTVWDPIWGDIFDIERGIPLTHPNCRCQLSLSRTDIDVHRLFGELKVLLTEAVTKLRSRVR